VESWIGKYREQVLQPISDSDSLLALAQGARVYKFCRPRITEKNIIYIKGGRYVSVVFALYTRDTGLTRLDIHCKS